MRVRTVAVWTRRGTHGTTRHRFTRRRLPPKPARHLVGDVQIREIEESGKAFSGNRPQAALLPMSFRGEARRLNKQKGINEAIAPGCSSPKKITNRGLQFLGFDSEGNIGLMRGADNFEWARLQILHLRDWGF